CPMGWMTNGTQCCVGGLVCVPCGSSGSAPGDAARAVTEAALAGVHTFIIGVATDTSSEMVLNMMAQNGQEPRPGGPPYYYLVQTQQDLVNVITNITGQLISCSFQLQTAPANPDYVHIIITPGNTMVPRDPAHMNGWDFGPGNLSIQFYGPYCQQLQSAQ